MAEPSTPENLNKRKSNEKYTPSRTSYDVKLTSNGYNVRLSMAEENLRFQDEDAYEKYPDFQKVITKMVFGPRDSTMRPESIRAIKEWRAKNAMNQEVGYYGKLIDMVVKDDRVIKEARMVTMFEEDGVMKPLEGGDFMKEILKVKKSFKEDEMIALPNLQFNHKSIPRITPASENKLGMTTPKPDWVFGIEEPQFGELIDKKLSEDTKAWIRLAQGVRHPFFAIENKSARDSIENAENQAVRSGAAMVNAYRQLLNKAKDNGYEEQPGCDKESYAFTCSWVPQMANLHVHWHELLADGTSLWHMNLLKGYLFSERKAMNDFRADVHNILDWGIAAKRKKEIGDMLRKIAECKG